jgi:hypothetical protein
MILLIVGSLLPLLMEVVVKAPSPRRRGLGRGEV